MLPGTPRAAHGGGYPLASIWGSGLRLVSPSRQRNSSWAFLCPMTLSLGGHTAWISFVSPLL